MKPHPSIFSEALQRLGVQPSDALMVGDSIRDDVEGALGAGMRAALVHRSGSRIPARRNWRRAACPMIRSLSELMDLI